MAYTTEQRLSMLENRLVSLEALISRLVEAINQCVTLDQVNQLEILSGSEITALTAVVQALQAEVDLLRTQGYQIG